MEGNPFLAAAGLDPGDVPGETESAASSFAPAAKKSYADWALDSLPESSLSAAQKILRTSWGPRVEEVRAAARARIAAIKGEQPEEEPVAEPPPGWTPAGGYAGGFGPSGPAETIPAPDLTMPDEPFSPSGGFGPSGPAETIPAPDLTMPDLPFSPSGGFGPKGYSTSISPPPPARDTIPAPDVELPLPEFTAAGGRAGGGPPPAPSEDTIPLEESAGSSPISFISDAISGKGGKGMKGAADSAPQSPAIKAPPIASQVPPPPPEAPPAPASMMGVGLAGAGGFVAGMQGGMGAGIGSGAVGGFLAGGPVGAMIGAGAGAIGGGLHELASKPGSVSEFQPGTVRHASETDGAAGMQSIVAALTRMSGIRSRL